MNTNRNSLKSLFSFCRTSGRAVRAAAKVAALADHAEGQRANRLASISSALNEQRLALCYTKAGMITQAAHHSRQVGLHLRAAGC